MKPLASILNSLPPTKIIDASINISEYTPLNLSVSNEELISQKLDTSEDFEKYISNFLKENSAKVAFGGYIEGRFLYQRSPIFWMLLDQNVIFILV